MITEQRIREIVREELESFVQRHDPVILMDNTITQVSQAVAVSNGLQTEEIVKTIKQNGNGEEV